MIQLNFPPTFPGQIIPDASSTTDGLMSAADKAKLDSLGPGALPPLIGVDYSVLVEHPIGTVSWATPAQYAAIIGPLIESPTFNCAAGLVVGTLVYIDAPNHVVAANAGGLATMPAIGFVASKATPTTCLVQHEDPLGGFVGLISGTQYFASTVAGGIAKPGDAGFPTVTGQVVQRVGVAVDATHLLIDADDIVVL